MRSLQVRLIGSLVTAVLLHVRLLTIKWRMQFVRSISSEGNVAISKLRTAIAVVLLIAMAVAIGALASLHVDAVTRDR
jgi:hypothetical protein